MNPDTLITILQVIAAIAILVFIHEMGHFVVARLLHVEVEEFGIGFPPRMVTLFHAWGTRFSLNWLPLGGFVRPKGESDPTVPGGMAASSPWVRIAILAAGPAANLLAAVVIFAYIFMRIGVSTPGPVYVQEVSPGSPAETAGLKAGDLILAADGVEVQDTETLHNTIYSNLGSAVIFQIQRGDEIEEISIVPRQDPPPEGAIGIAMRVSSETRDASPLEAIYLGGVSVAEQIYTLLTLPVRVVEGSIAPEEARLVGYRGMVDIYQGLQDSEAEFGIPAGVGSLFFMGTISVSLGLLNLLPIPALDGGRILFTLPELILRRRIPPAYEAMINTVSLALLVLLMIYINIQDFVNPVSFR
jgi:regulator of sigma E protease